MPLNEREQKILDEIERQFQQEDPDLNEAASQAAADHTSLIRRGTRLSIFGVVVGLVSMLITFPFNQVAALFGFGLMVLSVSTLVTIWRKTGGKRGLSLRKWKSEDRNPPRFFRR